MAFNIKAPPPSGRAPSDRSVRGTGPPRELVQQRSQTLVQPSPSPTRSQPEDDYVLYTALYDYKSDDPDDLCFVANDIIQVTDEGDGPESWMEGRSQDGREGSFPGTFVRKLRINVKKKIVVTSEGAVEEAGAVAPPPPQQPTSAAPPPPPAAVAASAARTVVSQPPPAKRAPPPQLPQQAENYVLYQALYDYKSDDPDDLEFQANDILRVTDEGDGPNSWMEGESQDGRSGSFPGNFVRKIKMQGSVKKVAGLDHL